MSHIIEIDFTKGKHRHRRLHGGGKQQALAKALGIKCAPYPSIIDATAGLGKDAFQIASLGCDVTLIEQQAELAHALQTALTSAKYDAELTAIIARMTLVTGNAMDIIPQLPHAAVIYLDPMFEARKKSALVKKDMQQLQAVVTEPANNDQLLAIARQYAEKRVVVKRTKTAPFFMNAKPSYSLTGKSCRFDVYLRDVAKLK